MSALTRTMAAQTSQPDQVHLLVNAKESSSYEATKLENPDSSAMPAVAEGFRNNGLDMVATPRADDRKCERHDTKSHMDGMSELLVEVHRGEGAISQAHVNQDDLKSTCDVSRQEIDSDPESMQYYTKLRSVLRRVIELERRLGVVCDEKSRCRERIQLGLEVSVAGERGVWALGFPFMMVFLAFIAVIIPHAYKYTFSA
ncbi:hypothetical protein EDB85DRAFT_1891756 [Lactarius pseudohatsudake]|nr:hypothetical protein EDB85DRAFT_1891752 [Lactarius pseudohatsudake]KAH9030025.1 hypothetical protein EDB85DRAFT_1891756 [Lactarius pseudohatsudake]